MTLAAPPFATSISGIIVGILSPLLVLLIGGTVRALYNLFRVVDQLSVQVGDINQNGSERLETILGQARRNERAAFLAAAVALIGWAMRGVIPRR